jgi:hypothetical protein
MRRLFQVLILSSFFVFPEFTGHHAWAQAVQVEERQGVVTEAPDPRSPDVVPLDRNALPPDWLLKLDKRQIADILEHPAGKPRSAVYLMDHAALLIPAMVFGSLTLVTFFIVYFSYRKRRDTLDAMRTLIQSGQNLPASVWETLTPQSTAPADSDLRKAVLLLALGCSMMLVLAALADEEAGPAWSIGLVPALLGLAYLFLWWQSWKRSRRSQDG